MVDRSKKVGSKFLSGPQRAVFVPPRSALSECNDEINSWFKQRRFQGKFTPEFHLHADHVEITNCDFRTLLDAATSLKTISDIRWEISSFKADTMQKFKTGLQRIEWPFARSTARCKVKTSSIASRLYHEARLTEVTEKIIARSCNPTLPKDSWSNQKVFLQVNADRVHVLLSLRGEHAGRRSYLTTPVSQASMRAPLVAAILRWHWQWLKSQANDTQVPQIDTIWNPFAGSAVFGIECAAILLDFSHKAIAGPYAFSQWDFIPDATKNFFLSDSINVEYGSEKNIKLFVEDLDPQQCTAASNHLAAARERLQYIEGQCHSIDFFKGSRNHLIGRQTYVCANPPFGMRLKPDSDLADFFKSIGKRIVKLNSANGGIAAGLVITPSHECASAFSRSLAETYLVSKKDFRTGGKLITVIGFTARN